MIWLISFIILSLCFCILMQTYWIWSINQARRKGLYPQGNPTMFDVRRLIIEGEKKLAVRLYAELFKTNSHEARKSVEELEKGIQEKHFKIE